ncbi:MAG: RHS repeat-associated core domain-containing protein [Polyangiales bacterium]
MLARTRRRLRGRTNLSRRAHPHRDRTRCHSFGYDALGRTSSASSNGASTGMGYDVMGQLARVTPPGRGDHTMRYSADERLQSYDPPSYTDPDAPAGSPRVATPSAWTPGADRGELGSYTVTRGTESWSSTPTYDPTTGRLASTTIGGVPGNLTLSYAPRPGEPVDGTGLGDTGQLRHASMPQTRDGLTSVSTTLFYDGPLATESRTEGLVGAPWTVGYHHDVADDLRLAHLTVAVGGATTNVPTLAYDYDADGLITSVGYGYASTPTLREGSYDETVAVSPTGIRAMAVVPDPATGMLAQTCVGNVVPGSGTCSGRVSTTITPNDFGEPASVETTWNGTTVTGSLSFHYDHDRAGRIVARTEVEGATSTTLEYGYDPQGRLENVWRRTSPTTRERLYHYQYDANGNRIGWDLPSGSCDADVSTCVLVDEQDRLLSAGGVRYRYDLQGQLATRTEGTREEAFTYDMAGNLRAFVVREAGTQTRHVEYAIDAFGRRVGRYVSTSGETSADRFWVYQDGLNPVAQLNASGQLELLFLYGTQAHVPDLVVEVRGPGAADDVVYRVVTDQVGSVRRLVNVETGAVAASFDYSPFGVLEREEGSLAARFPFRFAGGLWDGDTGLVRFGARDYDPRVGRWTAKDPILWGGGQANLYEYVSSSPVRFFDPAGEFALTSCDSPQGVIYCGGVVATVAVGAAITIQAANVCLAKGGVSRPGDDHWRIRRAAEDRVRDENGDICAILALMERAAPTSEEKRAISFVRKWLGCKGEPRRRR